MDKGADSGYYSTLLPARSCGYAFTIPDITWTCRDIGGHGRSPVPPLLDVAAEVVGMDADEPPVADDRDRPFGDPPPERLHRAAENGAGVVKREEPQLPDGVSLRHAWDHFGQPGRRASSPRAAERASIRTSAIRAGCGGHDCGAGWLACAASFPHCCPPPRISGSDVWATRHGRPSPVRTCHICAGM